MQSNSRNEIATDIEYGIEMGHYKDCIHLVVSTHHELDDFNFSTHCRKLAFEWEDNKPYCDPKCHYFEDKKKAERAEKWRKRYRSVGYRFSRILEGVLRFHWTERIVVLVIFLFFVLYLIIPRLVPPFIELLKALRGS